MVTQKYKYIHMQYNAATSDIRCSVPTFKKLLWNGFMEIITCGTEKIASVNSTKIRPLSLSDFHEALYI